MTQTTEQTLALALFHARDYLTFKLGGRKRCDIEEIVCDDEIYEEIVKELASEFESFYHESIAKFLETTGQYVTNDASREAAISAAIESYKAELLKEVGEPVAWRGTRGLPSIINLSTLPEEYNEAHWEPLYTSDQVAAAVLKATKPLEEQLSAEEQYKSDARLFRKLLGYEYWHRQKLVGIDADNNVRDAIAKAQRKYMNRAGDEELTCEDEELTKAEQRIAELEAENERLKGECLSLAIEATPNAQLAASQLRETQLRKALIDNFYFLERHSNRWDGVNGKHPNDIAESTRAILAMPADTSALDAYVAEKVKEAYIPVAIDYGDGEEDVAYGNKHQVRRLKKWLDKFFAQKGQIANLTRQRDLAVSELETVATGFDCDNDAHRYGSYCRKCEANKALSTIKGEVKE